MRIIQANPHNEKHRKLYELFCKEHKIKYNDFASSLSESYQESFFFFLIQKDKIIENCKIEVEKDLKKATLQLTEKQESSTKVKEVFPLLKNCIEYLLKKEIVYDVILMIKESHIEPFFLELGYDISYLGKNEKGQSIYSIMQEM